MTPNEKVTKQDVDFIETALPDGPGGHFDAFATAEAFAKRIGFDPAWGRNRVSKILRKTRTVESENWEPTCHNVRERVRADYARQQEPTRIRFIPSGETEYVSILTGTDVVSGARVDVRVPIAGGNVTPAPETNPPIGGKAWGGKVESLPALAESRDYWLNHARKIESDHAGLRSELDLRGRVIESLRIQLDGVNSLVGQFKEERDSARAELARTKAALASIKADDSGLRAALEKCEATLEGARVHSIGASGGIQWADVVLPGGLLVRVKGGAAK